MLVAASRLGEVFGSDVFHECADKPNPEYARDLDGHRPQKKDQ